MEQIIIYKSYTEAQKKAINKYYDKNRVAIQEKRRVNIEQLKTDAEKYEIRKQKQREASKRCYYKKLEKNNNIEILI